MEEQVVNTAPVAPIQTRRGLLKFLILNFFTVGIYSLVYYSSISSDINLIATRHDGKKTMHYCLLFFLVGPITFGIAYFVWAHRISKRIGAELARRDINYSFGAGTYWGWNILGSFIGVGPFVYIYKLSKAMNLLCEDYNERG